MTLAFKKVLITGGSRGIGRALAEALGLEGCEVMICARDATRLREAQQELGARAICCDITRGDDIARLERAVRGELGGLDVLINNAGIQMAQDVVQGVDPELADRELAVNLAAPIHLTAAFMPLLLSSDRACIVNVTSAIAIAPSPRSPIYAASKAGLAAWTNAIRLQLAGTTVGVMEAVPPLVATDMTAGRQDGAVAPDGVAAAIVAGLRRGADRVLIGKARSLALVNRLSPALAGRIMAKR